MENVAEALRLTLEATRPHIPGEDLRRLVQRWSVPTKVVARVVEVDPAGSLCTTRAGICLVPGVTLAVGERVNAAILPVPAGFSWSYWAETHERVEDGWSLEANSTSAKRKQKSHASASSSVHANDHPQHERGRRTDHRGAQRRGA